MRKTIGIIVIILLIAIGAYLYFSGTFDNDTNHHAENQTSNSTQESGGKDKHEPTVENLFQLAEDGKIPGHEIVVGKTNVDEVYDIWGKSDDESTVKGITYMEYSQETLTIGVKNDVVLDLRSSQEAIQKIDLEAIKDYKGEPDAERYFQDEDVDQIILVYELPNDYVLKWVLPDPDSDNDNPNVDHIALSNTGLDDAADDKGDNDNNESADNENGDETGQVDMNLDEKIGQMIFSGVDGTEMTADTEEMISTYHVGGIILFANNIDSPSQTVTFLNDIKDANPSNSSPLLLGVDEEGGRVTRMPDDVTSLPNSRSIGNLNDPDLSYEVGTILGKQMNEMGFNLDFAPVLDVNSNPDNPVIGNRSFGDNLEIVSRLGIETMKGIQDEQIISVIKHFPGHGDTGVDSHLELPKVNKSYDELKELELVPFQNAIDNGADVTMIAHILMPKIDPDYPASMSGEVITNMLREDAGFDGVVITDDLTMQAITDHYDIGQAALQSVKAGSDLMLVAHEYDNVENVFRTLKEAVENGELSEERIDESVRRIQDLKEKYHVTDEATEKPDFSGINEEVESVLEKVR